MDRSQTSLNGISYRNYQPSSLAQHDVTFYSRSGREPSGIYSHQISPQYSSKYNSSTQPRRLSSGQMGPSALLNSRFKQRVPVLEPVTSFLVISQLQSYRSYKLDLTWKRAVHVCKSCPRAAMISGAAAGSTVPTQALGEAHLLRFCPAGVHMGLCVPVSELISQHKTEAAVPTISVKSTQKPSLASSGSTSGIEINASSGSPQVDEWSSNTTPRQDSSEGNVSQNSILTSGSWAPSKLPHPAPSLSVRSYLTAIENNNNPPASVNNYPYISGSKITANQLLPGETCKSREEEMSSMRTDLPSDEYSDRSMSPVRNSGTLTLVDRKSSEESSAEESKKKPALTRTQRLAKQWPPPSLPSDVETPFSSAPEYEDERSFELKPVDNCTTNLVVDRASERVPTENAIGPTVIEAKAIDKPTPTQTREPVPSPRDSESVAPRERKLELRADSPRATISPEAMTAVPSSPLVPSEVKAPSPPRKVVEQVPCSEPQTPIQVGNIPQFFFSTNRTRLSASAISKEMERINKALTDLSQESPSGGRVLNCSLYWKEAIYLAAGGESEEAMQVQALLKLWNKMLETCSDEATKFIYILTKGERDYLVFNDFTPIIQDIVVTHPSLKFLQQAKDFHGRYVQTVVARIFFCVNSSWTGRITATELRNSNFLKALHRVQLEEDINLVTDYFSYEHFYRPALEKPGRAQSKLHSPHDKQLSTRKGGFWAPPLSFRARLRELLQTKWGKPSDPVRSLFESSPVCVHAGDLKCYSRPVFV
ncbi:Serine/threonine-protein phosphatase 2A regulatory subunit B'' subunit alpha [Cichlidogyrus casuarinus]|uniref:Serine/threonine-protein phosphatase 2A regulatory subunit B'' subunit alpha n=1 Tax=Cichlidogyrus casuarinus TaxID=1844966 RepID=A0ABD2Q6I7_9PLAT